MLRDVLKIELVHMPGLNIVSRNWPNDYNVMQQPQILHGKFGQFQVEPETHNMLQHVAAHRNRVAKHAQHAATNNVAICSYGRGFTMLGRIVAKSIK